ncbi:hypothetical protein [Rhizobium multihospitium]|uniref:Uncharacterized protein n=1 Tax=Rhizobium multihospitium TaxID=410764 RepID=A0A1C3XCZ3_9HYPH|nr:hypothetical protein [Rhizobium multihospitium]SCB50160.1 hypothetical protein GA0061103_0768 [Rhizobium multihospitium]
MNASQAQAQAVTSDPGAWRAMSYANLQAPSPATATYIDIWKDALDANNRHYESRGDRRFAGGNAPATEAHFIIWSSRRSAVFTILDTASQCTTKASFPDAGATVKLCPMRIAIYEGLQVRTMDGGKACFLELAGTLADANASGAYASYDVASRSLKTGLIVNHTAVDGCSFSVPLPRQ